MNAFFWILFAAFGIAGLITLAIEWKRRSGKPRCACLEFIGDNNNCPIHGV